MAGNEVRIVYEPCGWNFAQCCAALAERQGNTNTSPYYQLFSLDAAGCCDLLSTLHPVNQTEVEEALVDASAKPGQGIMRGVVTGALFE